VKPSHTIDLDGSRGMGRVHLPDGTIIANPEVTVGVNTADEVVFEIHGSDEDGVEQSVVYAMPDPRIAFYLGQGLIGTAEKFKGRV
jgi:hypothetical protein